MLRMMPDRPSTWSTTVHGEPAKRLRRIFTKSQAAIMPRAKGQEKVEERLDRQRPHRPVDAEALREAEGSAHVVLEECRVQQQVEPEVVAGQPVGPGTAEEEQKADRGHKGD